MLKEVDSKKKEKEKAQINKAAEENNDDVGTIEIPDTLKDLKDDAYVLIPVSFSLCICYSIIIVQHLFYILHNV